MSRSVDGSLYSLDLWKNIRDAIWWQAADDDQHKIEKILRDEFKSLVSVEWPTAGFCVYIYLSDVDEALLYKLAA